MKPTLGLGWKESRLKLYNKHNKKRAKQRVQSLLDFLVSYTICLLCKYLKNLCFDFIGSLFIYDSNQKLFV